MCQAVRDGGRRCPQHRHGSVGIMKAVRELHPELNSVQVERMFSELRREGRDSNIPVNIFSVIRSGFLASNPSLSDSTKKAVKEQFKLSEEHDGDVDSATIYALSTLISRTAERETVLKNLFIETAERSSLTYDEVKKKFWSEYNSVDTSRGSETPTEYDQNTRRRALLANLPYDRASVVAIERLKNLSSVESTPVEERVRRITLEEPAAGGGVVQRFGWHNGRLEVVFAANPGKVYAYRNITQEQWDNIRSSSRPGAALRYVRQRSEHIYSSEEEAERDGYAIKCISCGQFRSETGHECPAKSTRENLTNEGFNSEEVNAELAVTHPEEPELADKVRHDEPVSETEALERIRDIQEEENSHTDLSDRTDTPTRALSPSTAGAAPTYLAAPDMPDIRDSYFSNITEPIDDIEPVDHPAFMSVSDIVNLRGEDLADPLSEALYGSAYGSNPVVLESESEGGRLFSLLSMYDLTTHRLKFANSSLEKDVTDVLSHNDVLNDNNDVKGLVVVVAEAEPSEDDELASITRITAMYPRSAMINSTDISNHRLPYLTIYPVTSRYIMKPRAQAEVEKEEAEFESKVNSLVNEGKAVRLPVRAAFTTTGLSYLRGYTGDDDSNSRIKLPKKADLAAAYQEGKAVETPIHLNLRYPSEVRNGVNYGSYDYRANISGSVITRMTPDGEVQLIGQSLKCGCSQYRMKYACQHIAIAINDIPLAFQEYSKPLPASTPGLGEAGQRALRAAHSGSYDAQIDPRSGRARLRINRGLTEAVFSHRSNTLGYASILAASGYNEHREERARLTALDVDSLTESDRQDIHNLSLDEQRKFRSNLNPIRMLPIVNQTYLTALPDTDVELPVSITIGDGLNYRRVMGSVVFKAGSTFEDPKYLSRDLKCECPDYKDKYDCQHIRESVSQLRYYLIKEEEIDSTRREIMLLELESENLSDQAEREGFRSKFEKVIREEALINNMMYWRNCDREQAIEAIEEDERERIEDARRQAERLKTQSVRYDSYRNMRLAAWETVDAPLSENLDKFKESIEDARRRKRRGEKVLEFKTENVTDGICAPDGRGFGVEIEFEIDESQDRYLALKKIGEELHEAGLSKVPHQTEYHSANGEWDGWSFEEDCTVHGEIVSPILHDTPEDWEQLNKVIEIVNRNGGKATRKAGSHVNISSGSFAQSTAKHAELTRIMKENQKILFQMASDPHRGSHRGNEWCDPNLSISNNTIPLDHAGRLASSGTDGTHGSMVNFDASIEDPYGEDDLSSARIEYRLFDGTLDSAVIQQQVALSAALTDYAERQVEANNGYTHREADTSSYEEKAASLFDKLFRTSEGRAEATKLFGITNKVE